jgi:hypothetical protein
MSRSRSWLVAGMVIATAVLVALGLAAVVATTGALANGSDSWAAISFLPPIAVFSIVGGLIVTRRPGNPVGWLLAAIGLLFAIVVASSGVARWGLETGSLPQGVAEWISVASSAWVIALGLIGTQLPLRLPDGALPSPRWRWYSRISLILIAVALVGMATQQGRVENVPGSSNPLGSASLEPLAGAFLFVIAGFAIGIASLVVRYRRADSLDRVQLRWIAFGGLLFLAVYLVTLPLASAIGEHSTAGTVLTTVAQAAFAGLPAAIGYAILRHRLYDIDVVINRTLVYGALTATLAVTYLGTVLVLQLLLNGMTGDSGLAVAASTLAVAALFRPARATIQAGVDRRFFRRKYDAARTLEGFSVRLRDEVHLSSLDAELRGVVAETMQPTHVSLWLRAPEPGRR